MLINLNGDLITDHEPVLFSANRAFRYGDGLFETIRVFDGKIPFLPRHWLRLSAGMEMLKIEKPFHYTTDFFQQEIERLTKSMGNWRIRLSVWREGEGLYTPSFNQPSFLIEATPIPTALFQLNEFGLSIGIYSEQLLPIQKVKPKADQNPKTIAALPFVLASIYKMQNGFDDCLMLNTAERLACGTSSNLFLVMGNEIRTPPSTEGCITGTMRAWVMENAEKIGFKAIEMPISIESLASADEIILTNAIQGIRWVGQSAGIAKRFGTVSALRLTEAINKNILNLR